MGDAIFVKLRDGSILKMEGDKPINSFVIRKLQEYGASESVAYVYTRVSWLEPDPRVRDKIMARLFLVPGCIDVLAHAGSISEEWFARVMKEQKDHLTYSLFPMAPEFDNSAAYGLGYGGAFLRSISHVPKGPSSFFFHDWSRNDSGRVNSTNLGPVQQAQAQYQLGR